MAVYRSEAKTLYVEKAARVSLTRQRSASTSCRYLETWAERLHVKGGHEYQKKINI